MRASTKPRFSSLSVGRIQSALSPSGFECRAAFFLEMK